MVQLHVIVRLRAGVRLYVTPCGTVGVQADGEDLDLGLFDLRAQQEIFQLAAGKAVVIDPGSGSCWFPANDSLLHRLYCLRLSELVVADSESGEDKLIFRYTFGSGAIPLTRVARDEALVLSRFAYVRRNGSEMVLESPLSPALATIKDATLGGAVTALCAPTTPTELERLFGAIVGPVTLNLLIAVGLIIGRCERQGAGGAEESLWEFHDLLFHSRSRRGRHSYRSGRRSGRPSTSILGVPQGEMIPIETKSPPITTLDETIRTRRSKREFNVEQPIRFQELVAFLTRAGLLPAENTSDSGKGPVQRLYPSAGGLYALTFYLVVDICAGLSAGMYKCGWPSRCLHRLSERTDDTAALLEDARQSMGANSTPQVVVVIAARFAEAAQCYSSIAYANLLKDVGIVMQQLSLVASDMNLSACALGNGNSELFAKAAGTCWFREGSIGEFAIGASEPAMPRQP